MQNDIIKRMASAMIHRGPVDNSQYLYSLTKSCYNAIMQL
mgnify:CR=1 FL=1